MGYLCVALVYSAYAFSNLACAIIMLFALVAVYRIRMLLVHEAVDEKEQDYCVSCDKLTGQSYIHCVICAQCVPVSYVHTPLTGKCTQRKAFEDLIKSIKLFILVNTIATAVNILYIPNIPYLMLHPVVLKYIYTARKEVINNI